MRKKSKSHWTQKGMPFLWSLHQFDSIFCRHWCYFLKIYTQFQELRQNENFKQMNQNEANLLVRLIIYFDSFSHSIDFPLHSIERTHCFQFIEYKSCANRFNRKQFTKHRLVVQLSNSHRADAHKPTQTCSFTFSHTHTYSQHIDSFSSDIHTER